MTPARLALVDDDQQFVEYLETLLKTRGYDVQPFTSGTDLLQSLHGDTPPDVVLLDVSMPGMDGLTLVRQVKGIRAELPVIIITGFSSETSAIEAVNLGVAGYLRKPFRVPEVLAAAAKALGVPAA